MQQVMHRPHRTAAAPPMELSFSHIASILKAGALPPRSPSSTLHHVTSCNDDPNDPGSLRSIVAAQSTVSGDHIDFAQLGMMCSTITLNQGQAIEVDQDTLYLDGPGAALLTINANNASSAIYHFGAGTLYVSDLTIVDGQYIGSSLPTGGCIYSQSNVFLLESVVTHCNVTSSDVSKSAYGGGVYTRGGLTLFRSAISDSAAFSTNGADAAGGGAFVGGFFSSHYSTIDNNWANALGVAHSNSGGASVAGMADIEDSTISRNHAGYIGGLYVGPSGTVIANSTISGNVSTSSVGGAATGGGPFTVANSTIAFNRSIAGSFGNGLYAGGTLTLENSIIADNAGVPGTPDLDGGGLTVTGGHNLVASSTLVLSIGNGNIEGICPKLDPLLYNGGYTHTHGLNHASPAIDTGEAGNTTTDQRGAPRPTGVASDIGALERQPTDRDERILASNFDGFCDF